MRQIDTAEALRAQVRRFREAGQSICLVPTMGNLHDGHLALVRRARELCDRAIVSIFVNPRQFGANEDFASYPRTLAADLERLEAARCDGVFLPSVEEIYGAPSDEAGSCRHLTTVSVTALGDEFCGASRPGHFAGVATVVAMLFNMTQADSACFGLKDYQQFLIVRQLARDLHFPTAVIGVETVREADGLAMSSRNRYLTAPERQRAVALHRTLLECEARLRAGERDVAALEGDGLARLAVAGTRPDYLAIRDAADLRPLRPDTRQAVVLGAVYLGATRLIDNVRVSL